MLFWILCALMALLVTVALLLPLWRGGAAGAAAQTDVDVYRDQLAEVERDLARGVLDPDEAERTRTEIARRLLAADRAGPSRQEHAPRALTRAVAVATALLILLGGGFVYLTLGVPGYGDLPRAARLVAAEEMRTNRPSQAEAEAAAAAGLVPEPVDAPEDYLAMVEQLRQIVPTRPDDLAGWELLARHEAALGNYAAAARAQQRVVEIEGEAASLADRIRLADLLVVAAGGFVSPQTEALMSRVLQTDPENLAARYYWGLLYSQTDRPDLAFRLWRGVVTEGSSDDPHVRLARLQIEEAAMRAGLEYRLPPEAPAATGPTMADIEAAENLTPAERAEMVRGMVSRLLDRLATQGGPAEEWAQLIASLAVLGETERANAILQEARAVFAGNEADLAQIEAAADQAGLGG